MFFKIFSKFGKGKNINKKRSIKVLKIMNFLYFIGMGLKLLAFYFYFVIRPNNRIVSCVIIFIIGMFITDFAYGVSSKINIMEKGA